MPKRKQQRKEEAAEARHDEAESGGERTPTPPAQAEGMASAPLTGIHSLPNETLVGIFSFLPIPDLARCAGVCERWQDIVMGFTRLWEGKRYRSDRSPRDSAEVYAVLRALPPLREVDVSTGAFCIDTSYPRLSLTVRNVPYMGSAEMGVFAQFLSDDRLDTTVGMSRLRVLHIECPGLMELTFLQRYSEVLRELELKDCDHLPSAAYAALGQLGNLQSLRLHDCRVDPGGLEVALQGMQCLESLQLEYCNLPDLSCLQHCERLQDLGVMMPQHQLTGLRDLHSGLRSLHLDVAPVTADELSQAAQRLPQLQELYLGACELAHLDFLCDCPNLRELTFYHSNWPDTSQLSNLRHLARLEVLHLRWCWVDADVLSGALPSLTRLHTLSLTHADLAHLQFLQHCRQLRTLSLDGTVVLELESYQELCHLSNLQTLVVSFEVREFVRMVVRRYLPNLQIKSSE